MRNYFKNLTNNINELNDRIATEQSPVAKAQLKIELKKLEEVKTNFKNIFYDNFSNDRILDLFSDDFKTKFLENKSKADERNNSLLERNKKVNQQDAINNENRIQEILNKNPLAESEENKDTPDYKRIKECRKLLARALDNLENPKLKFSRATDYMLDEEFELFFERIITAAEKDYSLGKRGVDELAEQVKKYVPKIDSPENEVFEIKDRLFQLRAKSRIHGEGDDIIIKKFERVQELTSIIKNSSERHAELVRPIESAGYQREKEIFEEAVNDLGLTEIADIGSSGFKYAKTNEEYKQIEDLIQPLETDNNAVAIQSLLQLMDSLGMVSNDAASGESQWKAYGFTNFLKAKYDFLNEINKPDDEVSNEEFIEKFNKLDKEAKKIDLVFDKIKELLGDDVETMPTNVDSVRNSDVPLKYSNQLALQAKFNELYITLSFIKEHGLTIDEFVHEPIKYIREEIEKEYEQKRIDKVLAGKTKIEAIYELTLQTDKKVEVDTYAYSRSYELFMTHEKNYDKKKENVINNAAIFLVNGGIKRSVERINDYFGNANVEATLQNILLGGENFSYEAAIISKDNTQQNLRTTVVEKETETLLERISKEENFEEIFEDSLGIIKKYNNNVKHGTPRKISTLQMLKALQELTVKFMMTHNLDEKTLSGDRLYSKDFIKRMKTLVIDYTKIDTLNGVTVELDREHNQTITKLMKKSEGLKKKELKTITKNLNREEKQFIKETSKLNKQIASLEKKVNKLKAKYERNNNENILQQINNFNEEITNKKNTLENKKNTRLNDLRTKYEDGVISKYYLEKRTEQIEKTNDYSTKPEMFLCDEKNYKTFKNYYKNVLHLTRDQIRDEDFMRQQRMDYINLIEPSKAAKNSYYANKVLETKSMHSVKVLDADIALNKNPSRTSSQASIFKMEMNVDLHDNIEVNLEKINELDKSKERINQL